MSLLSLLSVHKTAHRLRGNTLLITVVLALVIGMLCSLLIMLAYNSEQVRRNAATDRKLERNLGSAISLVLADTSFVISPRNDLSDLFGDGDDSAWIRKENWGLYTIGCVRVMGGRKMRDKLFFFGQPADQYLEGCLYLAEQTLPLSLVGNTRLTGDGYLPKAGLQPAFLDQRSFGFTELIRGAIRLSTDSLPAVDRRLLGRLTDIVTNKVKDTVLAGEWMTAIPDTLTRSFADMAYILYQKSPITLASGSLKGHILVLSDSSITVDAGMTLDNIFLAAPVIRLGTGFTGRLQAFATDSLIVKDNCRLGYPSTLTLCKTYPTESQPALVVGDSCLIEGAVISSAERKDPDKTYVEVGKHSTIEGLLRVSGYLFLKGGVRGTVMTDNFIYRSPPNILLNYLVDAEIDYTALPGHFTGPHIFNSTKGNKIVQWVE